MIAGADVLLVSLAGTTGLREADAELADAADAMVDGTDGVRDLLQSLLD